MAEVFADENCTIRATGTVSEVFVRVNKTFVLGDLYQSPIESGWDLQITNSDIEYPDDPCDIFYDSDFRSDEFSQPFTAGQVVKCSSEDPIDVTGINNVFYDDGSGEVVV